MAPDTRDGIWVGDQYYILATAARTSGRSAVLKSGDTFAVFDRTGDIAGPGEHGLYHDGTRHLSLLTLSIAHDLPLLLSSRTSVSNELFGADLTNPDLLDRAARWGLHDPGFRSTATDLFEIALQGCRDLGPGYLHPLDLEQAEAFFDQYTRRGRALADDVLEDAVAA